MTEIHFPPAVLPVHGVHGTVIGTGTVVAPGFVLTALHVIDPEPVHGLQVGEGRQVAASATLPLRRYGEDRHLALISYQRDRILTGGDLGTADLAMLAVPDLDVEVLSLRHNTIRDGEMISVPGYPTGERRISSGPVVSHDDANFIAEVALQTGNSGSPALDRHGRVAGLAILDYEPLGAIFVGPQLLLTFTRRAIPLLTRVLTHDKGDAGE
ncbi:S1 family peptidase [Amycolatopsis sp. H20-H5]|uniref:S1 family peptidase n=1 Tax=Amycolatopsis sp. H20-H5 TaxID=3046309 RepID=UPI002DBD24A1|nr:serine protease [Amycolatopsis sp. H20-H5]MEC3976602.1 serine protease [Amycolatopsis sp. H20-H5]